MMHHKAALLGTVFFICFLISSYIGLTATLVCFGVFSVSAITVRFLIKNNTAFFVLTGAAAAFLYFAAYSAVFITPVASLFGKTCDVTAEVISVTKPDNDKVYITASGAADSVPVKFTFACSYMGAEPGDTVEARVTFSEPLVTAAYSAGYNYSRGIFVRTNAKYADIVSKRTGFSLRAVLSDYSEHLRETVREYLPGEEGAVMLAMCFGDKSRLSTDLSSAIAGSGLSHMTAVSGMHISLIVAAVMSVLDVAGLKRRRKAKFTAVLILAVVFAVFFDFSASVCRSGIMIVACYGADLFRRVKAPASSLGAAVLVILLAEPCACRDTGLILSACGTFGAVYAAPRVGEYLRRSIKLPEKADILIVGFCASLFTLPVSALAFGRISLLSAFSSAAVYLLFLCIMILALVFAFSGGLLAPLVMLPAGVLLKAMIAVIRFFSGFRYSSISIDGEKLVPFLIAALIFISLISPIVAKSKHRRRYIAVTASVCVCAFAALITGVKVSESDITKISVYSDGKNWLASIENDKGVSAFSSDTDKKLSSATYSALTKRGSSELGLLCVLAPKKHAEVYSRALDDIPAKQKCFLSDAGNSYDISGDYTAYVYGDAVVTDINGVSVILTSAADAPAYGGFDIAVYNGYKKNIDTSINGITVLCDKRYTDVDNAYNAYYNEIEIRISKDGKVMFT